MATVIDALLALCFLLTLAAGVRNGFFREIFTLLGLAAGLVLALGFTPWGMPHLPVWARGSHTVYLLAFVLFFAVGLVLFKALGSVLASGWEGKKGPGGLSRLFGLFLGSVRGFVMLLILAGALVMLLSPGSPTLERSRVLPYLGPGVVRAAGLLPRALRDDVVQRWQQLHFGRIPTLPLPKLPSASHGGPTVI